MINSIMSIPGDNSLQFYLGFFRRMYPLSTDPTLESLFDELRRVLTYKSEERLAVFQNLPLPSLSGVSSAKHIQIYGFPLVRHVTMYDIVTSDMMERYDIGGVWKQ